MKHLLFPAWICIVLISCSAKTIPQRPLYSTIKANGLNGPVTVMENWSYSLNPASNEFVQDSCCIIRIEYDKNGNEVKSEAFNTKGELQYGIGNEYHSNGLVKKRLYYNKERVVTAMEDFVLDSAGNYASGKEINEGRLNRTFTIGGQNQLGNWTQMTSYRADGTLMRTEEFIYEGKNLVAMFWKNKDGKIIREEKHTYNKKGERIATNATYGNFRRRVDSYDRWGNWTQSSSLDSTGKAVRMFKRKYSYR